MVLHISVLRPLNGSTQYYTLSDDILDAGISILLATLFQRSSMQEPEEEGPWL